MPTRYERGRSAENYVKHRLIDLGADIVARSARSLGLFDLMAFFLKRREIWLIQVKTSKTGVDITRVERDYKSMEQYGGQWNVKTGFFFKSKDGWKSKIRLS